MRARRPTRLPGFANPKLPRPDPKMSVFINCPFDADYEPLLDALVFTAVCCGFHPRTADESEAVDVPRMDRILHAIFTSCYSIHDLSRCRGEGEHLLARFNMPLELGMVIGRQFVSGVLENHGTEALAGKKKKRSKIMDDLAELSQSHRWLVLVPAGVDPRQYLSDLGNYDLKTYNGEVTSIVPSVMSWFYAMQDGIGGLKPKQIIGAYPKFRAEKAKLTNEWAGQVPWPEVLEAATRSAPRP